MLYTLEHVRDNIRNREGRRVFYLGKNDQLTCQARDYLNRERIEILPAQQAKPAAYRLLGGGFCQEKPEHMTHLNAQVLVNKTHPRILFRGHMDTLEAQLLLCMHSAPEQLRQDLEQVLALARNIIKWDVLEEVPPEQTLCGLTPQQLRERSHRPQDYYGQPHFMPSAQDSRVILELNLARCVARQAELAAVAAFSDRDNNPTRPELLQMLNRMSSMLYILMIQQKGRGTAGK